MLESVSNGWEESGAQDKNLEMRVAAHPTYTSEGVFDIFERGRKLGGTTIVFVKVYTKVSDALVALLDERRHLFTARQM